MVHVHSCCLLPWALNWRHKLGQINLPRRRKWKLKSPHCSTSSSHNLPSRCLFHSQTTLITDAVSVYWATQKPGNYAPPSMHAWRHCCKRFYCDTYSRPEYVTASKLSRIRWYNLRELLLWIRKPIGIPRRLSDTVSRKCPEKWRTNI
jgi:hypothetical protein